MTSAADTSSGDVYMSQAGRRRSSAPLFYSCLLVMSAAFSLGGGASNAYLSNAVVELVALPALILAVLALIDDGAPKDGRFVLILFIVAAFIVTLQLVPLPPAIWTSLPFHEKAAIARAAVGGASNWAPLSLDPEATIVSLLTALPPMAVFLATLSLTTGERRLLILLSLVFGLINGFVGLLQASAGEDSIFYLYGGDAGVSVGLFANRNHVAALLYALVPFAAAWIAALALRLNRSDPQRRAESEPALKLLLPGVAIIVFIVADLMAQSRAGVILLVFALVGGVALQRIGGAETGKTSVAGAFAAVALLAVMIGAYYGLYRTLSRFGGDVLADARIRIAELTYSAAIKALPFGTGLGTFVPAYASVERPGDLLLDRFANQAHNEYLQIALETGLPGVALMFAFMLWLLARFRQIWSKPSELEAPEDVLTMRAASLSIALLLAHSLIDYPLRTEALMAFFALCCGLLVPPRFAEAKEARGRRRESHPSERRRRWKDYLP